MTEIRIQFRGLFIHVRHRFAPTDIFLTCEYTDQCMRILCTAHDGHFYNDSEYLSIFLNANHSDTLRAQMLGQKIFHQWTVAERHIVADVVAAFEENPLFWA